MRYILVLLLFISTSCNPTAIDVECDNISSVDSVVDRDAVISLINSYAVNLEQLRQHQLLFEDSEIYYNETHLEKIWVKFLTQETVDLWGAREILTQIVDGYLEAINTDPFLRPFLKENFEASQIDVTVVFESFMGVYIDSLYVGSLNLQNGKVFYYAFDAFDISTDFWHQRVESYHKTNLLHNVRTIAERPFWDLQKGKEKKSALKLVFEGEKANSNNSSTQGAQESRAPAR
jgi:hypothetical protein